ncbi:MAG: tetratricopeptide repeat protein [Sphingomonadaceae bacterium]|nr:tetratricopeptide repeat protein [Sphingomonadaceae bacterium]
MNKTDGLNRAATVALAALSLTALTSMPAHAAKKDEKPAAPAQQFSPSFLKAIGVPQKKGDPIGIEAEISGQQWDAALQRVRAAEALPGLTEGDKYQIAILKVRIAQGKNDNALLREGLESAIASPIMKPEDRAKFEKNLAVLSIQANDYQRAADVYERVLGANPNDTAVASDLARIYYRLKQPQKAFAVVDKAAAAYQAAGQKTPEDILAMRYQLAYDTKANALLQPAAMALVKEYPTAKNWEQGLLSIRGVQGNARDEQLELDTYRLMRAAGALNGQSAYLDYANQALLRGLPGEARSVLQEGQQKGVVPPGNQMGKELAALTATKATSDRATLATSEREARTAKTGRPARTTADAYLGYGEYQKATELYNLALEKGGENADLVNTRIGIANALAGNKEAALAAFGKVQSGPRGELARWWEVYVNTGGAKSA